MKTTNKTKTAWLLILPLVLAGGAAIWGSDILRARAIAHMQALLQSHVTSVTALVKKSVSQGSWSTATIYSLYEERLLTTANLFSHLSPSQQQDSDTLNEEQIQVFLPDLATASSLDRWGAIPKEMQETFRVEMQNAPSFELLETPLLQQLGLVCMGFDDTATHSVLCHGDRGLTEMRKASGIGPLLDELVKANLSWVVLQDAEGVLAAAPSNASISRWRQDDTLRRVIEENTPTVRHATINGLPHMEGLAPFEMVDGSKVVIRVAVDATVFEHIRLGATRRHYTTIALVIIIELILLGATLLIIRWRQKQRLIEETLAAQEEEKTHWELIGGLSATVAHEVRNPLNTISMTSERLRYEFDVPESQKRDFDHLLQILKSEAAQLNKIVTDFLELGKPNRLDLETVDLDEFIAEAATHFAVRAEKEEKRLSVQMHSNATVSLDRRRFHQVLTNLLNNALDASGKGDTIIIRTGTASTDVRVDIEDEGEGMTDAQLKEAMTPFISFKANGTGLGLALVSRLVTLHRGGFTLTRNPQKGMTATIQLPRKGHHD
ncbi:MAG: ATP-binding protein [Deltaproteobacteria bacterium]|nr:ATP-binding protein [Deltaproteobacteria bacterium]